jgi:transposase
VSKIAKYVGLDVHKASIVIAVAARGESAPEVLGTIPNDLTRLLRKLDKLGPRSSISVCYEAGPTGFGLYRKLLRAGFECCVVAPSMTPQDKSSRVKTDRRDAARLARFLRSGDLTPIHVPNEDTEAMRDLVRARDACRQQLGKFLLRHDRVYPGKTAWTGMHLDWIRKELFDHEALRRVLRDYLNAVETATDRVARLTKDIEELSMQGELAPMVTALQALRGVALVVAATVACEIGDFRRFKTAGGFMSFLGLVPSENSSGESKRRGAITKAGNSHVRRALVEAAWAYRFAPKESFAIRKRSKDVVPEVKRIAWKAQHRLHDRYRRMVARGRARSLVVTAIARELAGFVWCIGQLESSLLNTAAA